MAKRQQGKMRILGVGVLVRQAVVDAVTHFPDPSLEERMQLLAAGADACREPQLPVPCEVCLSFRD